MKSSFQYRSYLISSEDGRYTAKSLDGEDFTLSSNYVLRVLRGIDALWEAAETVLDQAAPSRYTPSWIQDWLISPTGLIDLDSVADASVLPEPCNVAYRDPIKVLRFPTEPRPMTRRVTAGNATAALGAA